MTALRLFYSWQSDRPSQLARQFIELALEDACKRAGADLRREIILDSDTRNVPGTPPITETILGKIAASDIFCADMTFVAQTADGKFVPNPNVMGEYGYALHAKSASRILLVMNEAFGSPKDLPFDLHHLRRPTVFNAPEGLANGERRRRRARLADELVDYIKLIVAHLPTTEPAGVPEVVIADASNALEDLFNRINRNDIPALVSRPCIVIGLAPFAPDRTGRLAPRAVTTAMADLVPEGFQRITDGSDTGGWWRCDPPTRRTPGLNPEARWYVRINRQGVFDAALNIGERFQDDPHVVVPGHRLETMIVDLVDRASAALGALDLGPSGLLTVQLLGCDDLLVTMGRMQSRLIGQPVISLGTQRVDRIGEPLGDDIQQLLDSLWLAAGHRLGSPSFEQGGWDGYQGGTAYRL